MSNPSPIYERILTVQSFECDLNQRWKPAAISQHLTEAAVEHAAALGVGFDAMLAQDLYWVHSRMKIRFYSFPRVKDRLTIHTWPKTIQQKLFYIRDFEILDGAGERIVAATSAWLVINAVTRRLVMPSSLNMELPSLPDRVGLAEPLEKLNLTGLEEERLRVRAGYSAVDMLGHVNNSRYVEWICDAVPFELFSTGRLDWLQINYDHEVRPQEEVAVLASPSLRDAGLWEVDGRNLANQSRAFEAALHFKD